MAARRRPVRGFTQARSLAIALAGVCWACDGEQDSADSAAEDVVYVDIKAGDDALCALTEAGRVDCWGEAFEGAPSPEVVATAIDLDFWDACAVLSDGSGACWAWGVEGNTALPSPSNPVVSVATGWGVACWLDAAGVASCTGDDSDGATEPPGSAFTLIDGSGDTFCGLNAEGAGDCWGYHAEVFLDSMSGAGTLRDLDVHNATRAALSMLLDDGTAIDGFWGPEDDEYRTTALDGRWERLSTDCMLDVDGRAYCPGDWDARPDVEPPYEGPYVALGRGTSVEGWDYTCGALAEGGLTCWGAADEAEDKSPCRYGEPEDFL